MKSLIPAALAVVLIAPLTAQAAVEVSFTDPAKFTDASQRGTGSVKGRAQTLRTLKTFIERQAARHLAPGQDLKI